MPPAALKISETVHFRGVTGNSRVLDAAFLASLSREGPLRTSSAHWLFQVLPSLTQDDVTLRLLIFIFVPALVFAADLDEAVDAALFAPSPYFVSRFLSRLLKAGLTDAVADSVVEVRERVLETARAMPTADRLLSRSDVFTVSTRSSALAPVIPLMYRGADEHNGVVATFLSTLPGFFKGVSHGLMPAAMAAIVPTNVVAADPPELVALQILEHIRQSSLDPPFFSYLSYSQLLSELLRWRLPSVEARFSPLFERAWRSAFPLLARLFPGVDDAAKLRVHLQTLALGLSAPYDAFHEASVRGLCLMVRNLIGELDVELPPSQSPSADDRIIVLCRIYHRGRSSSTSGRLGGDSSDATRTTQTDEKFDKLLANADFVDLHGRMMAENTSTFQASSAVALALNHAHPAAHMVMITTRSLPQSGWSSVIGGLRQKSAWVTVFDRALAKDSMDNEVHDWGTMLPTDAKGHPAAVVNLVTGKFNLITDWWATLLKWIQHYMGAHVAMMPEYAATTDPSDFWLSSARMRLVEPAMAAIFSTISYGQSRAESGSFREWYHFHMLRATRISHIPNRTAAYATIVSDTKASVAQVFHELSERFATMAVRPFHEASRPTFLDLHGAAHKSFVQIDSNLAKVKSELDMALKGLAAYQAPHLQLLSSTAGAPSITSSGHPASSSSSFQNTPYITSTMSAASSTANSVAPSTIQGSSTGTLPDSGTPYPSHVFESWGDHACKYGVYLSPDGPVFGHTLVKVNKPGEISFKTGTCMAAAAANLGPKGRSQWCVSPATCKANGYAAHDRLPGTTNSDYVAVAIDNNTDRSAWSVVVPSIANVSKRAPRPPWSVNTGPGKPSGSGQPGKGGKGKQKGESSSSSNKKQHFQRPLNDEHKPDTATVVFADGGTIQMPPGADSTRRGEHNTEAQTAAALVPALRNTGSRCAFNAVLYLMPCRGSSPEPMPTVAETCVRSAHDRANTTRYYIRACMLLLTPPPPPLPPARSSQRTTSTSRRRVYADERRARASSDDIPTASSVGVTGIDTQQVPLQPASAPRAHPAAVCQRPLGFKGVIDGSSRRTFGGGQCNKRVNGLNDARRAQHTPAPGVRKRAIPPVPRRFLLAVRRIFFILRAFRQYARVMGTPSHIGRKQADGCRALEGQLSLRHGCVRFPTSLPIPHRRPGKQRGVYPHYLRATHKMERFRGVQRDVGTSRRIPIHALRWRSGGV